MNKAKGKVVEVRNVAITNGNVSFHRMRLALSEKGGNNFLSLLGEKPQRKLRHNSSPEGRWDCKRSCLKGFIQLARLTFTTSWQTFDDYYKLLVI